jgi:hypothetical protein
MPESTWGALTDADAGRRVTLRFWWDDHDTTATFVRTQGLGGYGLDGTTEQYRHVLDYGGEIGEQETQLDVATPVTVDAAARPATRG